MIRIGYLGLGHFIDTLNYFVLPLLKVVGSWLYWQSSEIDPSHLDTILLFTELAWEFQISLFHEAGVSELKENNDTFEDKYDGKLTEVHQAGGLGFLTKDGLGSRNYMLQLT